MSRVADKAEGDASASALDMATRVIVALPDPAGGIKPPLHASPADTTYLWMNTTVMGETDLVRIQKLLSEGWTFVPPSRHPSALVMTVAEVINAEAFCLMEKATAAIQEKRARERAPHMDLDYRAAAIMDRYTGDTPVISGGLRVSASKLLAKDEKPPPPLTTPEAVRVELAKRFAPADVRLFMQRHFGV